MSNVEKAIVARDGELTRFVCPFSINMPELRVRVQSGEETVAQFIREFIAPALESSIVDGVQEELEKGTKDE